MYKFTHKPLLKNDAQLKFKKWQKKKKRQSHKFIKKEKEKSCLEKEK